MIRVVTDSTCDLPAAALLAEQRVLVVPVNIRFDHESYQEGITLTAANFSKKSRYTTTRDTGCSTENRHVKLIICNHP
jgi:fatty acid-binding protein DegV